jgi:O-antigen/teichoic acid export membrane protein
MSTPTIQRQSILSTIVIFAGFGFGALNLIFLQPKILTTEQWGMTRVVTELAVLLASFSTLGTPTVVGKFLPFYKRYLPAGQIDLPAITMVVFGLGMLITLVGLAIGKPYLVYLFGKRTTYFESYYYVIGLFILFQGIFMFLEIFAWFAGKSVTTNVLKELVFRALTTVLLLAFAFKFISFDGFMLLFGCIYLPAVVFLLIRLKKANAIPIYKKISTVTRRLSKKMISLGTFVFLTSLSNIAFVVCDTLFLASLYNFSQAGIYAVAQYFGQVIEVPMRSMQAGSIPIISEYWRAKNMKGLLSIYRKSCINLLVAGMGLGGLIIINLHNLERFFPAAYGAMIMPIALLVCARWINLGTGLNSIIIQLSAFWRFDFASTLIYSIFGIPLNFLLISHYGMWGAAIANIIAMAMYNGLRFGFLYYKFGLQPFTWRNAVLLLGGIVVILTVYFIPPHANLYVDGMLRSALFAVLFAFFVLKLKLSDEVEWLWQKWVMGKMLGGDDR